LTAATFIGAADISALFVLVLFFFTKRWQQQAGLGAWIPLISFGA